MSALHSRRALFGAGAATLLLAAPAAGEAKARELDGELLDACKQFARLEAESEDAATRYGSLDSLDAFRAAELSGFAKVDREMRALALRIAATQPRTPEGLHAKAHAALFYSGQDQMAGNDSLAIALSVLRDLAGRTAA